MTQLLGDAREAEDKRPNENIDPEAAIRGEPKRKGQK